jgi:hypothetical protein
LPQEDSYQGMPSGMPKARTTVEERRFSAALSTQGRAGLQTCVKGHHVEPPAKKNGVPHFSRTLREVGTTNAHSAALDFFSTRD